MNVDSKLTVYGESFYNSLLPGLCERGIKEGWAKISEGALIVDVEGSDVPLMLRKSDGG